jgi:AmmeMemoRadiSam system protein B
MGAIREPAVAGLFYPADPRALRATVSALLNDVPAAEAPPPKALILPHAGYVYSGAVAARGYERLRRHRDRYRRVVLLGPAHRAWIEGVALPGAEAFRTPAGDVPLDAEAVPQLEAHGVPVSPAAHAREHSLEVHLPFLQAVLDEFTLVPLVVGDVAPDEVGAVLDLLWGGEETLIVVSTDLSHYLPYEAARARDAATCRAITAFDARHIDYGDACGAAPLRGLLVAARRRGLAIETLDLRNSGDTAGDRARVVGYGAWALA